MELLKAFKSPSSVSTGKKNLLSTYSKILFRFNFLRLPYYKTPAPPSSSTQVTFAFRWDIGKSYC